MRAHVIHAGHVGGLTVRFFRSPHYPAPDLPWPDLPALLRALGLEQEQAVTVLHKLQRDWPELPRRFATAEGLTVGLPFFSVRDLVQALPVEPWRFGQFMAAATDAMKAACAHLSSAEARAAWAMDACRFEHPAGGGNGGQAA